MRLTARSVHLRRQLCASAGVRSRGYVARDLAPGLSEVLGWEDDEGLHLLTRAQLGDRQPTGVWRMAEARPAGDEVRIDDRIATGGAKLWLLSGDHPWVATWLLDLEAWVDARWRHGVPAQGLLVAAPARSTLYLHRLGTADAVRETVQDLALLAAAGFLARPDRPLSPDVAALDQAPQPLVPWVYWLRDGWFERLTVHVDVPHARARFAPSAAFEADVL